ncbi:hypothetical protein HLB44_34460 [Aquincola sp. S2]|uniref:Porin n=1 Tax=Pseudaquabacterium terrae TaxID=2732868 RepID=A0ABX2EUJ8_9BURK|nr:hypothetical protein [Aquabacterium terrae]NRF72099.1 hypothetical protein [Aquabacterium terrae]
MHRMRRLVACLLALAAATAAGAVSAQTEPAGRGLRFEGFGTLGVARSDMSPRYSYLREILQPASERDTRADVDSRLGLQLNWSPSPRWDVVAQAVLSRRAPTSPAREALTLAFAAWHPGGGWDLRAGRLALDAFLLADYRHLGYAYPWVRPFPEFYGWIPFQSFDGGDASWRWSDGGGASWRAKLLAGRGRQTIPGPTSAGDVVLRSNAIAGAVLTREADGLTLKLSLVRSRSRLQPTALYQPLIDGLHGLQALPLPLAAEAAELERNLLFDWFTARYAGFGASYEHGDWLLHAEVSVIDAARTANDGRHAYASVGRRFGDFTLFVAGAYARSSLAPLARPQWAEQLAPLVGPELAAQAQAVGDAAQAGGNAGRMDQRSISIGSRWDFHDRRALKLQLDRVRFGPNGSGLWGGAGPLASRGHVLSATLDFVF